MEHYRKALPLLESIVAADSNNVEARRDVAYCHGDIGAVLASMGKSREALKYSSKSLATFKEFYAANKMDRENRLSLLLVHEDIGKLFGSAGDMAPALENYRQALVILDKWSADDPGSDNVRRYRALEYANIGRIHTLIASDKRQHGGQ